VAEFNDEMKIGEKRPDGTVYAGSLDGKAIFTTPEDAPLTYTFNEAAKYAEQLNAQKYLGHDDWRVPTEDELNVLFSNRADLGGFNETGSEPAGWYWSSLQNVYKSAWAQGFKGGGWESTLFKWDVSSLRCVRG